MKKQPRATRELNYIWLKRDGEGKTEFGDTCRSGVDAHTRPLLLTLLTSCRVSILANLAELLCKRRTKNYWRNKEHPYSQYLVNRMRIFIIHRLRKNPHVCPRPDIMNNTPPSIKNTRQAENFSPERKKIKPQSHVDVRGLLGTIRMHKSRRFYTARGFFMKIHVGARVDEENAFASA